MTEQLYLETRRLHLRLLELSDAPAIERAASSRQIADTMISVPHPYPAGEAERYVARQQAELDERHSITFVVEKRADESFCGLIEVRKIDREHLQAELSFWLVVEAWGRGYMTEAILAVLRYGFEELGLNRFYAYHMLRNPACGRLLKRNGFRQEGVLRQRVRKWGKFEDVAVCGIVREDWRGGS